MNILITIPHFYRPSDPDGDNKSRHPDARGERISALVQCLSALLYGYGPRTFALDHAHHLAWQLPRVLSRGLDIVVCTTPEDHLLDEIGPLGPYINHHVADVPPDRLGFECHRVLAEAQGGYDFYAYVEDDIGINDPLFFEKLAYFNSAFDDQALLQPNRYEANVSAKAHKVYVDYHMRASATAAYQDVSIEPTLTLPFLGADVEFERTSYPSSGGFFLNDAQLARWLASPGFSGADYGAADISYLGPLDSAATLSVMKAFRIYKPSMANPDFLESQHISPRWIEAVGASVAEVSARPGPFRQADVADYVAQLNAKP